MASEILTNLNIVLFHGGDPYRIETSPLICPANQWTGFYMILASVMKELTHLRLMFQFYNLSKKFQNYVNKID